MQKNFKRFAAASVLGAFTFVSSLAFQNCSGFTPLESGNTSISSALGGPPSRQVPVLVPVGGTFTDLKFESTGTSDQANVPITLGHVFALGSLNRGDLIVGKLSDGSVLPIQTDIKATHSDGSVRHAILSLILPKLAAGQTVTMSLVKESGTRANSSLTPADLVKTQFATTVRINLGGVTYTADAQELLRTGSAKSWLSGTVAEEWLLATPLKTAAGAAHPHLTARFAVRAFAGQNTGKVDVVIENNWAYEPGIQNQVYDVEILVGGKLVYSKKALTHLHNARWKKSFWWGTAPQVHVKHNTAYLIATRAVPNYDQSVTIPDSKLNEFVNRSMGAAVEPMATGIATAYMPTTGGREDIGLNPAWTVAYLLTMDKRAKNVTLLTADLSGSYVSHFRDKVSDRPLSVIDYPFASTSQNKGDTYNAATKKPESYEPCVNSCDSPNSPDGSHLPNLAYVAYLVTGDFYYLEELQFWGTFLVTAAVPNPYYREFSKGLLSPDQLRGQGWGIRILGEAAYITPDSDRLKGHFLSLVKSNLDFYNKEYTNNPNANKLGIIHHGYSVVYNHGTGTAPWQDDFFTQGIGHVAELGFEDAYPLLAWKAKFQIGRMLAPGYCWIQAGIYSLKVRDSSSAPFYTTLKQAYESSVDPKVLSMPCAGTEMATAYGLKAGEMTGYSSSTAGYPSNYQPALAYAVDSGAADGAKAWAMFMARSVKPNYAEGSQFNIIPRK